jgi:sigma-E factor negative regulatory protein RseC
MVQLIEHSGVINKIEDHLIEVLIIRQSACGECQAKGTCMAVDKQEKLIEVENVDGDFKVGETVVLCGHQSIGLQAVLLAFILPFVLILTALLVLQLFALNESVSGGIAVSVLIPYYVVLSFFNEKLKSKFRFEIRREAEI